MLSSSGPSSTSNVLVCVRIRPLQVGPGTADLASPLPAGAESRDVAAWTWEANSISQDKSVLRRMSIGPSTQETPPAQYAFDHIFDPSQRTLLIFDKVCKPLVLQALDGYHGAILAYGQTSSGKTFTMSGCESKGELGIIKLSVQACFHMICQEQYADREFTFKASMLEVWNEQVRDLLSPSEGQEIKIQSHPTQGTVVTGNKEVVVNTLDQVSELLARGEASRSVASTEMNEQSSRAHTLFRFVIESKPREGGENAPPARIATLNLVDLAGSENAKMTGSAGDRAREARHINQSLLTLSLIIQRLGEESSGSGSATRRQSAHMPYRDSKLTRLLEQSLDGSAHIVIICNISPSVKCCEETHNTLRFATRAKKIKIEARRNEVVDDKALLRLYRNEIEQLKARLDSLSRGLLGAPPSSLDASPSDSLIAAPEAKDANPPSAASQKSGSSFFFEIDESDDQETTLRMIGEMETLIKRVAQAARRGAGRKSTPAAPDTDAPLTQQRRRVSPGESEDDEDSCSSTESSPAPYAPTWRDSIGFSPATPPFDLSDAPSTPSGVGGGVGSGGSRGVGAGGWRHAFSHHAGSFDSDSSLVGAATTQHPFQPAHGPDSAAVVSRVATPVRAQQEAKQKTPDTDPARLSFHRRTSPNAGGGAAVVEVERGSQGALSILTSQSNGSISVSSNSSYTAEGSPVLSALRSRADSLRDSIGHAQGGGRERTSSSTSTGSFDGGEKALSSVSLLLLQLKAQIRNSRRQPPVSTPAPVPAPAPAPLSSASPGADNKEKELERLMDTLRLELRLKDADNKFLQAELEKKETLMDVLTEGLKEVEVAQETWLRNNEDLTVDLESAIRVIDELTAENTKLRQDNNLALDVLQETEQLGAENLRLQECLNSLERARERDAVKFSVLDVELDALKQRLQQVEAERDAARGIVRTNVAIFEGNSAK